jgi:hypothetical protein
MTRLTLDEIRRLHSLTFQSLDGAEQSGLVRLELELERPHIRVIVAQNPRFITVLPTVNKRATVGSGGGREKG